MTTTNRAVTNTIAVRSQDAFERAKIAAREFADRMDSEGLHLCPEKRSYVEFAFEIGYLRGRSDGATNAFDQLNLVRSTVERLPGESVKNFLARIRQETIE